MTSAKDRTVTRSDRNSCGTDISIHENHLFVFFWDFSKKCAGGIEPPKNGFADRSGTLPYTHKKWWRSDLNRHITPYQSAALPFGYSTVHTCQYTVYQAVTPVGLEPYTSALKGLCRNLLTMEP